MYYSVLQTELLSDCWQIDWNDWFGIAEIHRLHYTEWRYTNSLQIKWIQRTDRLSVLLCGDLETKGGRRYRRMVGSECDRSQIIDHHADGERGCAGRCARLFAKEKSEYCLSLYLRAHLPECERVRGMRSRTIDWRRIQFGTADMEKRFGYSTECRIVLSEEFFDEFAIRLGHFGYIADKSKAFEVCDVEKFATGGRQ